MQWTRMDYTTTGNARRTDVLNKPQVTVVHLPFTHTLAPRTCAFVVVPARRKMKQQKTKKQMHNVSVRQLQREANEAAQVGRRALKEKDEMQKQRDNALTKFVLNPHA